MEERKEVLESYLKDVQTIAEVGGEQLVKESPFKDVQKKALEKKKQLELK